MAAYHFMSGDKASKKDDNHVGFLELDEPRRDSTTGRLYVQCFIKGVVDDALLKNFLKLDAEFEKLPRYVQDELDEVQIYFSTPGGSVVTGFEIIDFLNRWNIKRKAKISFIVTGECCSMGIPIILHGTYRSTTENAFFLIHPITSGAWGTVFEIDASVENTKRLQERIGKMIVKKTKMSKDEVKKLMSQESYLTPSKAFELGIVEQIFEED